MKPNQIIVRRPRSRAGFIDHTVRTKVNLLPDLPRNAPNPDADRVPTTAGPAALGLNPAPRANFRPNLLIGSPRPHQHHEQRGSPHKHAPARRSPSKHKGTPNLSPSVD